MRRVAAEVPAVYAAAMVRKEGGLRVVIAGGGPAGLEALLGLREMAAGLVETTLVAPTAEFVYKPLLVDEPFGRDAAHFELRPFVEEVGGQFVREPVTAVDPDARHIHLGSGATLEYDVLVVCIGARTRPAFRNALSFDAAARVHSVDDLVGPAGSVAFVVPGGVTWPLPAYELALMTRRAGRSRDLRCTVVTPEPQPLALFGLAASEAVAKRLSQSGVECLTGLLCPRVGRWWLRADAGRPSPRRGAGRRPPVARGAGPRRTAARRGRVHPRGRVGTGRRRRRRVRRRGRHHLPGQAGRPGNPAGRRGRRGDRTAGRRGRRASTVPAGAPWEAARRRRKSLHQQRSRRWPGSRR